MNKLITCIEGIRSRLDGLRRHRLKETPTRTIVIDPILEALGWDIRDPDEVELEFPTIDGKSVDYALKLNRKPVLLLEAKALDDSLDDVKAVAQVVRYAAAEGIVWCVLTNGVCWRVYRSIEECAAPEKLMFEVTFDPKNSPGLSAPQMADRMWRFSREEMVRGTLDALGEQTFTDSKIRKVIDSLLQNPPRALLNLVRRAVGDNRLNPRRLRESLERIRRGAIPLVSAIDDSSSDSAQASYTCTPPSRSFRAGMIARGPKHSRKLASSYTEAHHTSGKPQEAVELYRAIERECLALRPGNVEKRYMAKCISYECNGRTFCSVHLQRAGLRVWLYLKYHKLDRPPNFARDVSSVGHWGGGDLELAITSMGQINDAKPLIHDSFDARVPSGGGFGTSS